MIKTKRNKLVNNQPFFSVKEVVITQINQSTSNNETRIQFRHDKDDDKYIIINELQLINNI